MLHHDLRPVRDSLSFWGSNPSVHESVTSFFGPASGHLPPDRLKEVPRARALCRAAVANLSARGTVGLDFIPPMLQFGR